MVIRFGVESANGKLRSSTWKVWSPKTSDDVFVACRGVNGAVKASFHRSGHWHIAFDKSFLASKVPLDSPLQKDRFAHRVLHRLDPSTVTLAIRIVLPPGGISIPQDEEPEPDVTWLPPPPEGKAVVVAVVIAPADWAAQVHAVGHYDLPSGPRVWVRYDFGEAPPMHWKLSGFHPLAPDAHASLASGENLRVLIPGHDERGMYMVDGRIESVTSPPGAL